MRPGRKLQSTIITNESAPVWGTGETFQFLVHIPDSQVLTAIMYDYDVFTKDDEIGRYSFLLPRTWVRNLELMGGVPSSGLFCRHRTMKIMFELFSTVNHCRFKF